MNNKPQHPGIIIKKIMESRGLTISQIAEEIIESIKRDDPLSSASMLGWEGTIQRIIIGERDIYPTWAKHIAHAVGQSADYWNKLQSEYDYTVWGIRDNVEITVSIRSAPYADKGIENCERVSINVKIA